MFITPYATTPFKMHTFDKTGQGIRRLEMNNELINLVPDGSIKAVPHGVTEFPPFTLFVTQEQVPTLTTDVVVDGRLLLKKDKTPVNTTVLDFYLKSAKLIILWREQEKRSDFHRMGGDVLPKLYGQWIRNSVSSKLQLDFQHQMMLQAAAVVFYFQLIHPITYDSSGQDVDRILTKTARALPRITPDTLHSWFGDTLPVLNNIHDFIAWVKVLINNPRIEGFTESLLKISLLRTWPYQYRDAINAAIEYPPLFTSIIYSSMLSVGFIRTDIGELIKKTMKSDEISFFTKTVDRFLG